MPSTTTYGNFQDWTPIVLNKRAPTGKDATGEQALKAAFLTGAAVDTSKKFGAGENKKAGPTNASKLEKLAEAGETAVSTVSHDFKVALQRARQAKKMTQKDLGMAINEKPSVINEYEAGKAVPNPQLISKMERALGAKLPRNKAAKAKSGD